MNKKCSIDKKSGLIILDPTNEKVREYQRKDYEQTLKDIEIFNKEYQYFKATGNMNKDYIEKLSESYRGILVMLNSCQFE